MYLNTDIVKQFVPETQESMAANIFWVAKSFIIWNQQIH